MDFSSTFGSELLTKDGKKSTSLVLNGKKIIGLYFSAHWCPPCRQFTPVLGTVYDDMIDDHDDFEIIFISSDRDEAGFTEYFATMPWKALPFECRDQKNELAQQYGVNSIPMLIFLNAEGKIITKEGRNVIAEAQGNTDKIYTALTQ